MDGKLVREGAMVEKEHMSTYKWLEDYIIKNKDLPDPMEFFTHIAIDHLKETKDYYKILKKMKL